MSAMQANPEDVRFLNNGATDLGFNFGDALFNKLGDYTSTKNPKGGPQDVTDNKDQLMLSWEILQQQSVEKRQEIVRSIITGVQNPLFKIMPIKLTDKGIFKQEYLHFSGDGYIERTAPGTLIRNITTHRDTMTGHMHYTALGFLTNYYSFKGPDAGRQAAMLYAENMKRVVAAIWNAVLLDTSSAVMRTPSYYVNPEQVWGGMKIPDTPEEYMEIQSTRYLMLNREAQSLGKIVSRVDAVFQQTGGRAEYMMIRPKGLSLIKFRDETNLRREYSGNKAIANRQDVKALTNTESVSYGGITGIMLPRVENKLHQDISDSVTEFPTAAGSHFGHVPCFTDVPPAEYKSWMSYIRTASWETNDFDEYSPYFGMRYCPQFIPMNDDVNMFGEKGNSDEHGKLNKEWLDEMVKNIENSVHTISNAKYDVSPDISLDWNKETNTYRPITCIGELDDRTPDSYFEYMRLVFAERLKKYTIEQILPHHPLVSKGGSGPKTKKFETFSSDWEERTYPLVEDVETEKQLQSWSQFSSEVADAWKLSITEAINKSQLKKSDYASMTDEKAKIARILKDEETPFMAFTRLCKLIVNECGSFVLTIARMKEEGETYSNLTDSNNDGDRALVYKAAGRFAGSTNADVIISAMENAKNDIYEFQNVLPMMFGKLNVHRYLIGETNQKPPNNAFPPNLNATLSKWLRTIGRDDTTELYREAFDRIYNIISRFPLEPVTKKITVKTAVQREITVMVNKNNSEEKFKDNTFSRDYDFAYMDQPYQKFESDNKQTARWKAFLNYLSAENLETKVGSTSAVPEYNEYIDFLVRTYGSDVTGARGADVILLSYVNWAKEAMKKLNSISTGFENETLETLREREVLEGSEFESFDKKTTLKALRTRISYDLNEFNPFTGGFFTELISFVKENGGDSLELIPEKTDISKYKKSEFLTSMKTLVGAFKDKQNKTLKEWVSIVATNLSTKVSSWQNLVVTTKKIKQVVKKNKSISMGSSSGMPYSSRGTMSFSSKRAEQSESELPSFADDMNDHFKRRLKHYISIFGGDAGNLDYQAAIYLLQCPFDLHTMRAFDKYDIPPFAFPHYLRPWETRDTSVLVWASDQQLGVTHIDKAGIDRTTHYDPVTGVYQDNCSLAHQAQVMNNAAFFITPMAYGGEELGGCGKRPVNEGLSYNQNPDEWGKMLEKIGDGSKLRNRSIICTLMSYEEALHAPKWLDIRGRFHQGDFPYIHPSYQFTPVDQLVPPMYGGQFVTMEAFGIKNNETMMFEPNNMTMNAMASNFARNNICGQAYTLMYSHQARTKQQAMQAHHLVGKRLPGCADLESGNGPIYNGFSGGKLQYLYNPPSALKQEEMKQIRT